MANHQPGASLTINVAGDVGDPEVFVDELRAAFEGSVEPAPIMGVGLHDIVRYAIDWGPGALLWLQAAKPGFEAAKAGLEIAGKIIELAKKRPGVVITIPTRNGPVKIENANREAVAQVIGAELARPQ